MKIHIKQDKISFFGRRYVVYKGKTKLFVIRRLWLTPIPKYVLTDYSSGVKIGRIQNKFMAFRANARISIGSGNFHFNQKSLSSMSYSCNRIEESLENEDYKIEGNEGFSGAIFKNGNQIGEWEKNTFIILDGDAYEIDLDFDSDIVLIASMMVLVDTYRISVTVGGDIGWEIGNIGKKLKRKKSGWTPKEEN